MNNQLKGKSAVVTGGNSGIGLATATLLKSRGAKVTIVGRDKRTLEQARKALGGDTLAISADVSLIDEITHIFREQAKIDILFINAGASHCPPLAQTTEADFDRIMDLNVKGAFFTFVKALPFLNDRASVVFTCSVSHDRGKPGDPLYSASKAAVRSLVRTLAADEDILARKIRVNCVSPGAVRTPLTKQATPEATEQINDYIRAAVPMGRWGEPDEIAKAVLFLASDDSSYMTGAEVAVDGGLAQI